MPYMVYGNLDAMEKTTLYLPSEMQRELRDAARRSGRPQAELIRDALREYLRTQVNPRPKSFGLGSDREVTARESEAWLRREWGAR